MLLSVGGSGQALAQQVTSLPVVQAVVKTTTAVATPTSTSPAAGLTSDVAHEAGWLQRNGWPLYALVDRFSAGAPLTDEANCIAVAVYHEARGESLEGQLAVAKVIMNRAASGKYPTSWCGVVKQPWQFSFVNRARPVPIRRSRFGCMAQGPGRHQAGSRERRAERAHGLPLVPRRLCRSIVGSPPDAGRKDRRAHFLSRLTAASIHRPAAARASSWR